MVDRLFGDDPIIDGSSREPVRDKAPVKIVVEKVIAETEKGILVRVKGGLGDHWLPKKQIEIGECEIVVPWWLAHSKRLI